MIDASGETVHSRTGVVIESRVAVSDRALDRIPLPEVPANTADAVVVVDLRLVGDGARVEPEPAPELAVQPDGLGLYQSNFCFLLQNKLS